MAIVKKMEENQPVAEVAKPSFRPGVQYIWGEGDKSQWTFNGNEFAVLYNGLAAFVNTPEVVNTLRVVDAFKVLQDAFINGIAEGVVTEVPQEIQLKGPSEESEYVPSHEGI